MKSERTRLEDNPLYHAIDVERTLLGGRKCGHLTEDQYLDLRQEVAKQLEIFNALYNIVIENPRAFQAIVSKEPQDIRGRDMLSKLMKYAKKIIRSRNTMYQDRGDAAIWFESTMHLVARKTLVIAAKEVERRVKRQSKPQKQVTWADHVGGQLTDVAPSLPLKRRREISHDSKRSR